MQSPSYLAEPWLPPPPPYPPPNKKKKKTPFEKQKKIPIAPTQRDLAMYGYRPAMKAEIYYYF